MSKRELYESKTEEIVMPIINENNFELVDVEYVREGSNWYLRIYIDKSGGINIDDCELVSRYLSEKLDEKDFIEDAYILEVSSPGLGRPLKKEKDFQRSLGEEIEVKLYKAIDKRKEYVGNLISFDKDIITIEENEKEITFNRSDIALVRLALDF